MSTTIEQHRAVLLELLTEFDRICKKYDIQYQVFCGTALGAVRHKGFIPWDDDLDVCMLRPHYERFLQVAPGEVGEQFYVQGEFSEHWGMHFSKLRKNGTTYLEKFHPKDKKMHQGIYIDIFPCDNGSDTGWVRKLQFYASRVALAHTIFKRGYDTDNWLKKFFMGCCALLPLKPFHSFAMGKKYPHSRTVHTFLSCTSRYHKGIYKREWLTETVEMDFENMKVPVSAHYDELLTVLYGDYMQLPSEEDRKIKEHAVLIHTDRDYSGFEDYRDGMKFDVYSRNIH